MKQRNICNFNFFFIFHLYSTHYKTFFAFCNLTTLAIENARHVFNFDVHKREFVFIQEINSWNLFQESLKCEECNSVTKCYFVFAESTDYEGVYCSDHIDSHMLLLKEPCQKIEMYIECNKIELKIDEGITNRFATALTKKMQKILHKNDIFYCCCDMVKIGTESNKASYNFYIVDKEQLGDLDPSLKVGFTILLYEKTPFKNSNNIHSPNEIVRTSEWGNFYVQKTELDDISERIQNLSSTKLSKSGVINLGKTCYISSVLQMLLVVVPTDHIEELRINNPGEPRDVLHELMEVLQQLKAQRGSVDISIFCNALKEYPDIYIEGIAGCAASFFRYIDRLFCQNPGTERYKKLSKIFQTKKIFEFSISSFIVLPIEFEDLNNSINEYFSSQPKQNEEESTSPCDGNKPFICIEFQNSLENLSLSKYDLKDVTKFPEYLNISECLFYKKAAILFYSNDDVTKDGHYLAVVDDRNISDDIEMKDLPSSYSVVILLYVYVAGDKY